MTAPLIANAPALEELCARLSQAPWIAFDTEFVSEHSYRPQLCLVQVAWAGGVALLDPFACGDLTAFWELIAHGEHETIVHSGREELLFCHAATEATPRRLIDVQLAAALIGLEYPAGYGTLIARLLGQAPNKGETRTDWRRRPLSPQQLEYARSDVMYLAPLREKIVTRLQELNRLAWLTEETQQWLADVLASRSDQRWSRLPGVGALTGRSRTVARELWLWREEQARQRNCSPRKILRDDLVVELAKRRSADPRQIRAVRGMERGDLRQLVDQIARCIADTLAQAEEPPPRPARRDSGPQLGMLGQLLSAALASRCKELEVAPSLVATATDLRDLVQHRLEHGRRAAQPPALALGWRAEVVGDLLDQLLSGRLAIGVADPLAEQPLKFHSLPADSPTPRRTPAPPGPAADELDRPAD